MADFSFEVVKHLAELSRNKNTSKELNLVSFNGGEPKYDLRNWQNPDGEDAKMFKGITLTKDELIKLRDALNKIEL